MAAAAVAAMGMAAPGSAAAQSVAGLDSMARLSTERLLAAGREAAATGDMDRALNVFVLLDRRYDPAAAAAEKAAFAEAYDAYGRALYQRGEYSPAMDAHLQARKIAEDNGLSPILPDLYVNIGNLFAVNGSYRQAQAYYTRALEMAPDSALHVKGRALNNLVGVCHLLDNPDSAAMYARQFGLLNLNDSRYDYDVAMNNAMVAEGHGHSETALMEFRRAVRVVRERGLPPGFDGAAWSCMGRVFEQRGQLDSALCYLNKAHEAVVRDGLTTEQIEVLRQLAGVHARMGHREKALECKARYLELADSASLRDENKRLRNTQMLYDIDRQARTITYLDASRATQRKWMVVLGVVLAGVVALSVSLYRQKKKLKRAWQDLYDLSRQRMEPDAAQRKRLALSDEVRENLAREIMRVMDDTDECCSPDFSLERLAELTGSNPRYVSEVVNDVMGKNFRTLLNENRVRRAMQKLDDPAQYGHFTIKAISESVGYRSQTTFITVFTRQTGLKPSLYQRLAAERAGYK